MPKAAHVNWYKLARERQKRAMIPTPYALPMAPAAIKATMNPNLLSQLSALVGRGRTAVAGLPSWAKVTGALGTAGGAGAGIGALGGMFSGKDPSMLQQIMKSKYTPYAAAGLAGAGVLGGAAYMGNRAGKQDAKKKKKPEAEKQSNMALGAGAGAGLGGLAGGLYGALAPGYEQDPDSGRRRRRSRLMGALRGLAGGAAAGGLAGGAAGHFAGPQIEKILGDFLAKKQDAAQAGPGGMRTDATMQADPVESAKADAMKPAAPIPQRPTSANATMGAAGGMGAMPGLTNEMPGAPPSNALPKQAPVIPQGPAGMSATMGGMPPQQFGM